MRNLATLRLGQAAARPAIVSIDRQLPDVSRRVFVPTLSAAATGLQHHPQQSHLRTNSILIRALIYERGFPSDFPSPDVAVGFLLVMFSHPGFYCVVAESDGRIVGSNCFDERSAIAGVGPITVEPSIQDSGVGRGRFRSSRTTRLPGHSWSEIKGELKKLPFLVRQPLSRRSLPTNVC